MPDGARAVRARSRRARFIVLFLVALIWGRLAGVAFATWASSTSASMTVSSATISAPTGLAAQNINCVVATSRQVKLTWTATTSTFADGYEIFRSLVNGGPYLSQGTVSGLNTVTFTDSSVLASTTYYYVVQSSKSNWRSANSTQVSITTPTLICT